MAKTVVGKVLSNKMTKTIVVQIEQRVLHPKYKKYITRRTKLYAHDEKNSAKIGDQVMLIETRPISKLKRWRLYKIL